MIKLCSRYAIYDSLIPSYASAVKNNIGFTSTLFRRELNALGNIRVAISTSQNSYSSKFSKKLPRKMESKYINVGDYSIFPWATSGLESAVVVNGPGKKDRIAFDMGYPHRETFNCSHVFISHGHMDHVGGIANHAAIRALRSCTPKVTYYIPTHLQQPLTQVLEGFSAMTEDNLLELLHLHTVKPGEEIQISSARVVHVFPSIHRVKSQGYIVMQRRSTLKEDYKQLPGIELGRLAKEGVQIREDNWLPEVAYTGDSTFEIFLSPPDPNLLKVQLLITESTYIDDELDKEGRDGVHRARFRGHMHLQEFIDNAHLFKDVKKIILLHFSDKYSLGYLRDRTTAMLKGSSLEDKVIIGAIHKETFT